MSDACDRYYGRSVDAQKPICAIVRDADARVWRPAPTIPGPVPGCHPLTRVRRLHFTRAQLTLFLHRENVSAVPAHGIRQTAALFCPFRMGLGRCADDKQPESFSAIGLWGAVAMSTAIAIPEPWRCVWLGDGRAAATAARSAGEGPKPLFAFGDWDAAGVTGTVAISGPLPPLWVGDGSPTDGGGMSIFEVQRDPTIPASECLPSRRDNWNAFYNRYNGLVRRAVDTSCRCRAADRDNLCQEVWLALQTKLRRLRYDPSRGRLSTFLFKVAKIIARKKFSGTAIAGTP